MSYDVWYEALRTRAATDDALRAQLCNIRDEEQRNPDLIAELRGLVDRAHAVDSWHDAMYLRSLEQECQNPGSRWLGRMPIRDAKGLSVEMVTFVPFSAMKVLVTADLRDEDDPPPALTLRRGLQQDKTTGKPRKRWLWLTPATPEVQSMRVREALIGLGLGHMRDEPYVYRVQLKANLRRLFVPTCFDAVFAPYWAKPEADEHFKWGKTRDLETGKMRFPEVLAEVADHIKERPRAVRVARDAAVWRKGRGHGISADFVVGRQWP